MAKKSTWKFRYEMSEKRCDYFREDAFDHFVENEALKAENAELKARLAAMVAAGRTDVEV